MNKPRTGSELIEAIEMLQEGQLNEFSENPVEALEYKEFRGLVRQALNSLTEREQEVLTLRYGLFDGYARTPVEIARKFSVDPRRISQIERKGLSKFRNHPDLRRKFLETEHRDDGQIAATELVEQCRALDVFLINHLRSHKEDLDKIQWQVFEHLVAEFFASWGYTDVRLVGNDQTTAADIFALRRVDSSGLDLRYFVEVKRHGTKVGIEVIDRVHGAVLNERERHGWHVGMIVSLSGFRNFEKITRQQLVHKGLELKDRNNVIEWLMSYKPNRSGLWLPNPLRRMG